MPEDRDPAQAISVRTWIGALLRLPLLPVALLWPAGTWRWWEGWAVSGLWISYAVAMTVLLARTDPELLAERMKASPAQAGQKAWDKLLSVGMFAAGIALFVVPGLDVKRFGWSPELPAWLEILAMALHVPCFAFLAWVMHENTYLSRVVKISDERDHHVIRTGPYALVRHPMYDAVILLVLAFPLALGSRFGLIPALLLGLLLIVRTALEDRMLHEELPGYRDYAAVTRYRLVPGIW